MVSELNVVFRGNDQWGESHDHEVIDTGQAVVVDSIPIFWCSGIDCRFIIGAIQPAIEIRCVAI